MTTENHAEQQAAAQYSSIVEMLGAVSLDWERLQEMRDEREELTDAVFEADTEHAAIVRGYATNTEALNALNAALAALADWDDANAEELNTLEHATNGCADEDEAREALESDPLEVQVRGGWFTPGCDPAPAEEFMILLCTGGPAVRIMGELDTHGTPYRAWLEYQDWGTSWTPYFGASSDTLCEYAAHFIGGF